MHNLQIIHTLKARPFCVFYSTSCQSSGRSVWLVGTDTLPSLGCVLGTVTSNSFQWCLSQSWVVSLHTHSHQSSAEYSGGTHCRSWGSLPCGSLLWCSALEILAALFSPDSAPHQLRLVPPGLPFLLQPGDSLKSVSWGDSRPHLSVSHLSGINVLHCQVS